MPDLGLFEGFGVEIETMIVDQASLDVRPLADELLASVAGAPESEVERGTVRWSNELVLHVIEMKTNGPAATLDGVASAFHETVGDMTRRLEPLGARLLPTGAHPWMNPLTETRIWPHEHNRVYALYDRVFGCSGHGWSNLQATHINLPFRGDEEFGRLHAAVRLLLPLLPALAASTPFLDGRAAGRMDARLDAYRHNQRQVPELAGSVIPEAVFTEEDYTRVIFDPVIAAMRPHDHEGVLNEQFLNSRGAIARFDRGAIEIRVLDAQECPLADLAIVDLVVATLRALTDEDWTTLADQKGWHERDLVPTLLATIDEADEAVVDDSALLQTFGLRGTRTAGRVWWSIADAVGHHLTPSLAPTVERLLARGCLARALVADAGPEPGAAALHATYGRLADCLVAGELFF